MVATIYMYDKFINNKPTTVTVTVEFNKLIDFYDENGTRELSFGLYDKPIYTILLGDKNGKDKSNPCKIFLMENGKTYNTICYRMSEIISEV